MKSAKEIIVKWATDSLGKRITLDLSSGAYAGILAEEWQVLIDRIDEGLREALQEGKDSRKKAENKMLNPDSEYGEFWQKFYLEGCLDLPGLAEAFNCTRYEEIWKEQWNEVIRVGLHKQRLRDLDPLDMLHSIGVAMSPRDFERLEKKVQYILSTLQPVEQSNGKRWTLAELKGQE